MINLNIFGGLRIRLILLMVLALFPLGLIALWQTEKVVAENSLRSGEQLVATVSAASTEQIARIDRAVGAGLGLGSVALQVDLPQCRAAMSAFVRENPEFVFAGFVPLSGLTACTSAGEQTFDFSQYDTLQQAISRADVYVEVNLAGASSGEAVLIVSVPVFDAGALAGFISLSMPKATLRATELVPSGIEADLIGIATSGELFAISTQDDDLRAHLPGDMPISDIMARAGSTFKTNDRSGQDRLFSVTPPIADSYVIIGSWQSRQPFASSAWVQAVMPLMFSIVMWGAGMLVAYLGLSRLVLRHLKDLRSAMRRFALGERSANALVLEGAPAEFKEAERAFNRMVLLITEAEARQMTDLHDKEVLLREVHHRVKNNLQMIASIMNLQARSARTEEASEVLTGLQRRVRGLAMLHRSLYTQTDTSQVDARDLIAAVVADSSAVMPDSGLSIETDLDSVMLYPDQAVPLSMWMAEALTNAVKYVGHDRDGAYNIFVRLAHDGAGAVTVVVENTTGSRATEISNAAAESTGLGSKLMMAFSRQLEGAVDTDDSADRFIHTLRFDVQGFEPDTDETQDPAPSAKAAE